MGAFLFFYFWVINVKLVNEKKSLIIAVSKWHGKYICEIYLSWFIWILMVYAYASSTTYLLTRLPHAGLYNYNER